MGPYCTLISPYNNTLWRWKQPHNTRANTKLPLQLKHQKYKTSDSGTLTKKKRKNIYVFPTAGMGNTEAEHPNINVSQHQQKESWLNRIFKEKKKLSFGFFFFDDAVQAPLSSLSSAIKNRECGNSGEKIEGEKKNPQTIRDPCIHSSHTKTRL